jgi:hypothetical protein
MTVVYANDLINIQAGLGLIIRIITLSCEIASTGLYLSTPTFQQEMISLDVFFFKQVASDVLKSGKNAFGCFGR